MKRQALRRLLSGFLAAVMVAALLPVTAMAVSEPTTGSAADNWVNQKINELNNALPAGEAQFEKGDYLPITNTDLYRITVSRRVETADMTINEYVMMIVPGDGAETDNSAIPNYDSLADTPWETAGYSKIFIGAGITGIGNNSFVGISGINQVTFQDASDLTYVGENAFSGLSSAAFTDEGNQDDPGTLNLSNVETLGSYAFSGCSQIDGVELGGSITAVEEGVTTPNKIPERAFSGVQLDTVTIPEGITEIGVGAFAGNRAASAISLPSTLVTIGDEAFACSRDGDNEGVRELTIPEKVSYIGTNAFYGFTGMKTLTVESEVLTRVEDGAFGIDDRSAYHGEQTITGPDGSTEKVTMGTLIKTPDAEIANLFETGKNCYTGPISPLTLDEKQSYPASCAAPGQNVYDYKDPIDDSEKELVEILPQLRHHYLEDKRETIEASCTDPSYYRQVCDNLFVKNEQTNEWERTEHYVREEMTGKEDEYQPPHGHKYVVKVISNDGDITGKNGSTVTFYCENDGIHDPERDNGAAQEVKITLIAEIPAGETEMTLSQITPPTVTGGSLSWDDGDQVLVYDPKNEIQYFDVTFTPGFTYQYLTNGETLVTASAVGETHLQVGVRVARQKLDFSSISFSNTNLLVEADGGTTPIEVSGAPEELTQQEPEILYWKEGEEPSDTVPSRDEAWDGWVSATYSYDATIYEVDEASVPSGYTIEPVENGKESTVTITHRY